jgi:hypothetical protein
MNKKSDPDIKRAVKLQAHVTVSEGAVIAAEAERRGVTVSDFVARAALDVAMGRKGTDPIMEEVKKLKAMFQESWYLTLTGKLTTGKEYLAMMDRLRAQGKV